ncbi:uncharacterized protein LOC126749267 [Anthonomus grandis grandis]|uniref:uncharacterized protein LOC126749267 n=1 Tax=Anthonomus grandis grandis TaxID=2921223 RepID=UPI002165C735|nr:uncharacterized protein LOC126749267 [Anthonomus grandis grandis]XP_050314923.1 uncharacterized protein LOC126749267 [Anthonomus grandis grandis]
MEKGIQSQYKIRFPEIEYTVEGYESLEVITKTKTTKGCSEVTHKLVVIRYNDNEAELWENLIMLRDSLDNNGMVTIHQIQNCSTNYLRKLVEAIFHQTNIKIQIYTTGQHGENTNRASNQGPRIRERETYAIIVDNKNQDYSQVLKEVKQKIGKSEHKECIRSIRTTKTGNLLITTEKNLEALQNIESTLKQSSLEVRTSTGRLSNDEDKTTIFIKGLEKSAEKQEIINALLEKAPTLKNEDISLGQVREVANCTLTASVKIPSKEADQLTQNRFLRVGLVRCILQKQIRMERCSTCWSYDHNTQNCDGPNRTSLCYRCGKTGHAVKECEEDEYCPLCHIPGHRAGTARCHTFKRSLSNRRREDSKKVQAQNSGKGKKVTELKLTSIGVEPHTTCSIVILQKATLTFSSDRNRI